METSVVSLKVYSTAGKEVGSRDVSSQAFGVKPSASLLHQVSRWQRAKKRAGTHTVLTRAQASGGGAKPWKQKGTGRARAGSNTSPLWVGGGIAHGPKQRSYEFAVNKKQRRKALAGALTAKAQTEKLFVVDNFAWSEPKTKHAQAALAALNIPAGSSTLVVLGAEDAIAKKSLRNLDRVRVLETAGLNVYDVLAAEYLVISADALEQISQRLA